MYYYFCKTLNFLILILLFFFEHIDYIYIYMYNNLYFRNLQ